MNDMTNLKKLGDKKNIPIYFEIIKLVDINNITIIINDYFYNNNTQNNDDVSISFHIMSDIETYIKFSETLKYKINSKYLKHTIEIFRIKEPVFFSTIARFHLPCVRSYYDGITCYMLPSAISAYMTLTNRDIKYFIGKHDPISIINKYRYRGYGTILNKTEHTQVISYVNSFDEYKKSYNIKNINETDKIIGPLSIHHHFYTRIKKNMIAYIDTIVNMYRKDYPTYCSDFIGMEVIDKNGDIIPVKKWIIDAAYDLLNKKIDI